MYLTPESVEMYKDFMQHPQKHGCNYPSLSEIFIETEEAIAKHILFEKYIEIIKKPLPKIFFYIVMDELYKQKKANDGYLGYCVQIKML